MRQIRENIVSRERCLVHECQPGWVPTASMRNKSELNRMDIAVVDSRDNQKNVDFKFPVAVVTMETKAEACV